MFYTSTSGSTILKKSLWFLYEKCIYIMKDGELSLERSETLQLDKPLKDRYISKYTEHEDYAVLVTLEWIGAPAEFLQKMKFKELSSEDYINDIKERRKRKKK